MPGVDRWVIAAFLILCLAAGFGAGKLQGYLVELLVRFGVSKLDATVWVGMGAGILVWVVWCLPTMREYCEPGFTC